MLAYKDQVARAWRDVDDPVVTVLLLCYAHHPVMCAPTWLIQALRAVLAYEERSAHQASLQTSRTTAAVGSKQQAPHEATFDHWMEAYANFCFIMASARPSMAAVGNTAADVMLQLHAELEARADPFEPSVGCARWVRGVLVGIGGRQQGARRPAGVQSVYEHIAQSGIMPAHICLNPALAAQVRVGCGCADRWQAVGYTHVCAGVQSVHQRIAQSVMMPLQNGCAW